MVDSKVQGGDTTYAMPNFGELPGFAEAARAFQHTGASTEIPEPVLQLIASHEPKISEKDVESLINEVVSKSSLNRSAPQIAAFIAEAMSNIGAARSALSSLLAMGLSAAAAANTEASGDETPQQKMMRLWDEVKELNKSISDRFDHMAEAGIEFDPEKRKKQKELQQQLDQLDKDGVAPDDPRRLQLQQQLQGVEDDLQKQADQQIKNNPQHPAAPLVKANQDDMDKRNAASQEVARAFTESLQQSREVQVAPVQEARIESTAQGPVNQPSVFALSAGSNSASATNVSISEPVEVSAMSAGNLPSPNVGNVQRSEQTGSAIGF